MSTCRWCASSLQGRRPQTYCSRKCRQSAFRLRRRREETSSTPASDAGLRFAYADPPYKGNARRLYGRKGDPFTGAVGEVDHEQLIASLTTSGYAGWVLSASSSSLREVLALCPRGAHVAPWVKPIGVPPSTYGMHSRWEPLIVVGGRKCRPGVRDWLRAMPARGGGDLIGRKPIAFCAWMFDLLGMVPGDHLDDLFPGTGIVTRTWNELSSRGVSDRAARGERRSMLSLLDAEERHDPRELPS